MKDPKCPECGNTIFAYQGVASQLTLERALDDTEHKEKDSIGEHLKKVALYENKKGGSKTASLHNLLTDIERGQSQVILIYCPNCGTIIGTAGKDNV